MLRVQDWLYVEQSILVQVCVPLVAQVEVLVQAPQEATQQAWVLQFSI
ncbi:MAG: hypothetical protein HY591_03580 [Candidatus Omnitrophica bacterium]|nr:hypothetical protein [Candidatus Omnitrophota bacterium]